MSFSDEQALVIKLLIGNGHKEHRIAALFDCNQGRISEVRTGARNANVPWPTLHVGDTGKVIGGNRRGVHKGRRVAPAKKTGSP